MLQIHGLSWDEDAEEHIARHGIKFEEVEQAVQNFRYARRSGDYLCVLGQTDAGKYLAVFLDDEGDGIWYPVTARAMTEAERRLYRRQAARRRTR